MRDARLVRKGIATPVVDRAEPLVGIVFVEERTRPVVERLAGDGRVVGVHDAVDEADAQPARDQARLRVDHALQQGEGVVAAAGGVGVVAPERVGGQGDQRLSIPARCEELERAHAEVARRHAREDRARQRLFAEDALARRRDGEGTRGRDAQRRHRLADEVLAQDGAKRGASVAATRKRRASGALELDVAPQAVLADDLAQQDGPTVAELRDESAELMAGVSERERLRASGDLVADQKPAPVLDASAPRSAPSSSARGWLTLMTRGSPTFVGETRA